MDNSPEYIKMCRKAEEIQELRSCKRIMNWQDGDFYTSKGFEETAGQTFCIECDIIFDEHIWLPRQGQLQDMVWDIKDKAHRQWRFYHWAFHGDYLPITNHCSYIHFMNIVDRYDIEEILWLAFVMHEKFNKKWNGEEWT